jgi:hypothetical protein
MEFPDYCRIITTPMDLTLIRESLRVGEYRSPLDLREDMELMFSNSLRFNTDKKSRVVLMTKRLKEFFLDKFQTIVKVRESKADSFWPQECSFTGPPYPT